MIALDLESAPSMGYPGPYALQPWRFTSGEAFITSCAVAESNGTAYVFPGTAQALSPLLQALAGKRVATWNGLYDVSVLIACGLEDECAAIDWVDGILVYKKWKNGQHTGPKTGWSYSLAASAEREFGHLPIMQQFKAFKDAAPAAGVNPQYWETRGKMDAIITAMLVDHLYAQLDHKQQVMVDLENACIFDFAQSYVDGIPLDPTKLDELQAEAEPLMYEAERNLGLIGWDLVKPSKDAQYQWKYLHPTVWSPSKILSSPNKIRYLLYTHYGLPVQYKTKHETNPQPSTDKKALTYLADIDDRLLEILAWRENKTLMSKFIKSPREAFAYLGSTVVHPTPKIASTYTNRVAYSSALGKKGELAKAKIGIAAQQAKRGSAVRKAFIA